MTKTKRRFTVLLLLLLALPAALAAQRSTADAEVAFTYGVRAYNQGDWSEAVRRFEEAVAADPGNKTYSGWLELARQRAGSGREIETPEVARAVPGFLGEIVTPTAQIPLFEGRLTGMYGEDSNPVQLASGYRAALPDGTFLAAEDSDGVGNLDLRAEVRPVRNRNNWNLSLAAQGKQSSYQDFGFFDARQLSAVAQLSWGSNPEGFLTGPLGFIRVAPGWRRVQVLVQGAKADTEVDGEPFLKTTQAAASLMLRGTEKLATQIEVDYQDFDFERTFTPVLEKDGEQTFLRLSQYLYFGTQNSSSLRLLGQVGERSAGAAVEHSFRTVGLELAFNASKLLLSLGGYVREEDFDQPESNPLGSPRGDTILSGTGALTWNLSPAVRPFLRVSYTDRDSDFLPAFGETPRDFRRTETAIGFNWTVQSSR